MFCNSMDASSPSTGPVGPETQAGCLWVMGGDGGGQHRAGRKSHLGLQGQDPRGQVDILAGTGPVPCEERRTRGQRGTDSKVTRESSVSPSGLQVQVCILASLGKLSPLDSACASSSPWHPPGQVPCWGSMLLLPTSGLHCVRLPLTFQGPLYGALSCSWGLLQHPSRSWGFRH